MKTRSNMPLYVVECSNVKELTDDQINLLRCGDYLVKKDASGEHAYKVTFKSATGLCLTYHDASVIETQSYDLVDGHWVYNSEDKTPNLLDAQTENDVKELVEGGTLENAKPIYWHGIELNNSTTKESISFHILNNNDTKIDTATKVKAWADAIEGQVSIACNGNIKIDGVSYQVLSIVKSSVGTYTIYYNKSDTGYAFSTINIVTAFPNGNDDINKIN